MNTCKKVLIFMVLFMAGSNFIYGQTLKAWLSAGDESMEKLRYAEAIEYYNKALEFETEDLTVYYKVAEACRLYKDYERAAAWYGKILVTDRGERFPMAMFRYAEMKKYLGMYEEAGRVYERYATKFPNDTSYFGVKARKEIEDCKFAAELIKKKPEATTKNAGAPVNTVYSDFGASLLDDTVLYYSSLRFLYEGSAKKEDDYYVSRILMAQTSKDKTSPPVPLSILFNDAPTHNCNVAFSPDYRIMFFTRCSQSEEFTLDCTIYFSKKENGSWGKPEKLGKQVNMDGFTATHPAVEARGADGYTLYFVSDRPGSLGKLDIWKSDFNATFQFNEAVNAGPVINTFDDEMTPFYDTPNRTLYFSSYGHSGLGGMDIFKSVNINGNFEAAENMGTGYNTSVNDVYFTINRDTKTGTLSSNRTGSMFIRSKTCCYDIYYHKKSEQDSAAPVIVKDTSVVVIASPKTPVATVDEVTQLATRSYYDEYLPLEIYFDNDEPDKRTMNIKTRKNYETLYNDYVAREVDYKQNFAGTLAGAEKADAEKNIEEFFDNSVSASWKTLNTFCSKVETALKKGIKIELELRGRASPLAETSYNINLSKRRISSLINFMRTFNNGSLDPYLTDGSLKITEVAAGENLAGQDISDALTDKRNSVYNPKAAIERRIELINIILVQPENEK